MTIADCRPAAGEGSPVTPTERGSAAVEDLFEPTVKQRGSLLYRRDGLLTPPPVVSDAREVATRANACLEFYGVARQRLAERDPQPDGTLPDAPVSVTMLPVAAAAALLAQRTSPGWSDGVVSTRRRSADSAALYQHWISTRGLVFATEVALHAHTEPLWKPPREWLYGAPWDGALALGPLRNHLAACLEEQLPPVLEVLERYRAFSDQGRIVASYLMPSQRHWVAADIDMVEAGAHPTHARLLVDCVSEVGQLDRLDSICGRLWRPVAGIAYTAAATAITLVDGVGFDVEPVLTRWLDRYDLPRELKPPLAEALSVIPTDAAFEALTRRSDTAHVLPALRRATARFPRRALRLLDATAHRDVLREHISGHADLVCAELPGLPAATAALAEREFERIAVQTTDVAPEILRDPPWESRKRGKAATVAGLVAPSGVRCAWLPGQREEWRDLVRAEQVENPEKALARIGYGSLTPTELAALVVLGPERAVPILRAATRYQLWSGENALRAAAASFEAELYPVVAHLNRESPRDERCAEVILVFQSAELVELAAARLDRRTLRPNALRYLRRHSRFAAQVLIPRAIGATAKERRLAARVLRHLDSHDHGDEIRAAAAEYGPQAAAAVASLLEADPLTLLPARPPAIPDWVNIPALQVVRMRDGRPISTAAVANLLTMLMMADPYEPYAGVALVRDECDATSLADLAWELFRQWQRAGSPSRHSWVYDALGSLGSDDTVADLRKYVFDNRSDARAVSALDAFVAIGSDAALLALKFLGEKVKTKRVREGARERIEAVAERLGLTADQLADRLVPDLGLDAEGCAVLDYGPRRFTVGFDEQLRPRVTTEEGKNLAALPKPGAKDDAELAQEAQQEFRRIKAGARAVAADQIRRLERAMVTQRRFTVEELRTLFIGHPLRWHVTRRLVWGVYEGGTLVSTFRIAEDRGFADHSDDTLTLADDAVLGVPHPVQFRDRLAAWGELFADYELLQPFPQLDRETFTLPDELHDTDEIRSAGNEVEGPRFLGLTGRGWLPPETGDGGVVYEFEKPLPHGRYLHISANPGLPVYALHIAQPQTFHTQLRPSRRSAGGITFTDLDPITASEVLRDLAWLREESR
ncbi:DUF4132 domain-containing protein [Nocardia sp. 2]|uniref:DUF4132 domain-containing protein n=1 Tax=Nocardia acididurans TaxID=2802282 RepID=A0ABS1MIR8_9NOCA|nr:DUF4132 domain-containing protein [Nocardia acididurans]MBL1080224.1 DUF4132 domain-containing protein [Nocardia acididurans]